MGCTRVPLTGMRQSGTPLKTRARGGFRLASHGTGTLGPGELVGGWGPTAASPPRLTGKWTQLH